MKILDLKPLNGQKSFGGKAHVILMLEASQNLLSKLDFINDYWDNKFKLTDEVIKEITDQLRELNINDEDLF